MPDLPSAKTEVPHRLAGWWWIVVLAATLAAYFPALQAGFIWDDQPGHVTRPELQSFAGLFRIWFEPGATQQYYPLLHSFFWLQHQLWGDAPFGYHLVNVLLHATAAILFAGLLRRLQVPGAHLAALIFALHPVCVESVAWVSEQKNTLSLVMYLGAAHAYLHFRETRRPSAYLLATAFFATALLSKTVTATLPAALLVILWWRFGRIDFRRDVQPLLLWFGLALLSGLATAYFEKVHIGAAGAAFVLSVADRLAIAVRAPWFYLGKLLWPADLIFVYPRWEMPAPPLMLWGFAVLTAVVLAALFLWRQRFRGTLAAALFFGGTLFPALGFFNVYPFIFSFVADHFQYLACLGPLALVGGAAATRLSGRWLLWGTAAISIVLGGLTWQQCGQYRDPVALYTATLARNPDCWMAHNNLAEVLAGAGRPAEAIPHLERALHLRPDFPEALNNLGDNLARLGRPAEAVKPLERAIELQPKFAEAHNNLGIAYAGLGRMAEATTRFERALQLRPTYPAARFNLGLNCARQGQTEKALGHFNEAARLDPAYADAHLNAAIALTLLSRFGEALPRFERALQLNPASADAYNHFGRALLLAGRYDEAIARCQQAVELNPAHADAHLNLARAFFGIGRKEEAARHREEARRLGAPP